MTREEERAVIRELIDTPIGMNWIMADMNWRHYGMYKSQTGPKPEELTIARDLAKVAIMTLIKQTIADRTKVLARNSR